MTVQIEMTTDGEFVDPAPESLLSRVLRWSIVVAGLATIVALSALALWVVLAAVPIALAAAVIAWGVQRFRAWQEGQSFSREMHLRA